MAYAHVTKSNIYIPIQFTLLMFHKVSMRYSKYVLALMFITLRV